MATQGQMLKSLRHYNMHDGGTVATFKIKADFKDKFRFVFKEKLHE